MTRTLITLTTYLTNGDIVTSQKGWRKTGWLKGEAVWESLDYTRIYDLDGGPGEGHKVEVGTFDAHETVVATLKATTGAKNWERTQVTTVSYGNECDTVSQEGE